MNTASLSRLRRMVAKSTLHLAARLGLEPDQQRELY
jgi:hypothetical protein